MQKGKAQMITLLRGSGIEVKVRIDGPAVVIGEKINPTGRKKLAEALLAHNTAYVHDLAAAQVAAGADVLDINVGVPGADDVALLPEIVKLIGSAFTVPLCIDTSNPAALAAALSVASGKPLVNSVNGEEKSLQTVLPLVKDRGAAVIGLTLDDNGIPATAEARLVVATRIIERATQIGIPIEDIIIDPLVLTVGSDSKAASVTLRTIQLVREKFGVNINLGASNVSFGLPDRHTLNQTFLALAINQGATCMITDPMKLTATIRAADLLLGRDAYSKRWVSYFRQHPPEAK
jgi:5-methyltetrahydrofolate--homocysteine methyltransferase